MNRIKKVEDVSDLTARKLVSHVILPSEQEVKKQIILILSLLRGSKKYKNAYLKRKWKGVEPQVIWMQIYRTEDDYKDKSIFSYAIWWNPIIRNDLIPIFIDTAEKFRENLLIDWR